MYSDTITLFNHYKSRLGDMWYPTVIRGVHVNADQAAIKAKYGENSSDKALLNIHYQFDFDSVGNFKVAGKRYLPPKIWSSQTNDKLAETITFQSGESFDFFMIGEYESLAPIQESEYVRDNGFYNYMNREYDDVFAITSVGGPYTALPVFQITGA